MAILVIHSPATPAQVDQMTEALGSYIKIAVDIGRRALAGGGSLHADCEQALLDHGARQEDIWGADWYPDTREVGFESLINVRPRQGNAGLEIEDAAIRQRVEDIVRHLLGTSR